uniref:NB-ARC domain-containing protein n=1 Tax=Fagus sylvatica TaxID=28930 RepID=A0A2N9GMZ7_FAGSY
MMTEFAFSVAEKVIEKLGSLAYEEISSDLKSLSSPCPPSKPCCWMLRRSNSKEASGENTWKHRLLFHILLLTRLTLVIKWAKVIKELERLEEIAKVRAQFHLVERLDDKRIVQREMTHSFVRDSDVIGRDDDKEKIIDLLMHPSEDGTVPVISIVGIGGLGKTTLAQWVYNDERVAKNFASRIWVCVSEEFTVLKLAKEILKSAGGEISENMSMDKVQASLRSYLKEKRFFIVLDDVWNEDRNKWIGLKKLLIEGLPEDDCLVLFLKWAFVEGEEKQYPKLVEIGKQIVKKCSGVPLAVRTLGSLLYSKTEERDWISIRDNEIWKLEQKEDDILPASYGLNDCENLAALPEWLPNLTSLQKLQIGFPFNEFKEFGSGSEILKAKKTHLLNHTKVII